MILSTRITIRVVPGSSKDEVVGWLGDALKVKVRAQPEKGKANGAVIALLAKRLNVPERHLSVFAGHTSRTKVIEIRGMSDDEIQEKLGKLVAN